jgi:proteasome beta subunit
VRIPRSELAYPQPFDLAVPSFSALLRRMSPELYTTTLGERVQHVEGTTIVALTYQYGVVMAGDRRATTGNIISKRDMRKIFEADAWSAVGIAGAAGPGEELAKLFATQLEH